MDEKIELSTGIGEQRSKKTNTLITRSAKIMSVHKNSHIFSTLLCHNSHFSYGNMMKFTLYMQKFMANLINLTE